MKHMILSALAAAALATTAQAAVLDSNTFTYKYEADALPYATSTNPTWTRNGIVPTVGGGVLTVNTNPDDDSVTPSTTTTNALSYFTMQGPSWSTEAGKPFAVEMSVKLIDAPDNTLSSNTMKRSGLRLEIGDGARVADITILNTGVRSTSSLASLSTTNNQDGNFHTFQIVVAADHLTYDIYRDGASIGSGIAMATSTANSLIFGDHDNSGTNGTPISRGRDINVNVDYVRWDAALPVPEPTSMAAIGMGGLMLLRRHRR